MDDPSNQGSFSRIDDISCQPTFSSAAPRRQRSLETIIDLRHIPLTPLQRTRGESIFDQILEASPPVADPPPPFDPAKLLRLSLEENPSREGKDNLLIYILGSYDYMEDDADSHLPISEVLDRLDRKVAMWSSEPPEWLASRTAELADLLVNYFFLPLKSQATKTPQPTPHLTPLDDRVHTPTLNRISRLRATCLTRDSHRCVISGYFDQATAEGREPIVDDSGRGLAYQDILATEVAHIIPHALGEVARENTPLSQEKVTFWDIMKLFHPGMEQLLNGVEIDKPFNAMTLAVDLHRSFGSFRWYLDDDIHQPEPHAYIFRDSPRVRVPVNPIFRPRNTRGRVKFAGADNTDLPEPGLFALHRACARILGLSGAGEYIEKLLRGDEDVHLGGYTQRLEQGELDLGRMVSWRIASRGVPGGHLAEVAS